MIDEYDLWIYLGGPEPEEIKPLLDSVRGLPPLCDDDVELLGQGLMKKIDAAVSRRAESAASEGRSQGRSPAADDEPVSEKRPRSLPDTGRVSSEQGPTARSPSFDEYILAWPTLAPEPRRPSVEALAASAPEGLKITEPALELPPEIREQMGRLPFLPATSAKAPPPEPEVPVESTMEVPVMRVSVETFPLGDTSLQRAMALMPFLGNTAGTALVGFPRLTIEQYASFHGELSLWPHRSKQIYDRYRVMNHAARVALDEHWKRHFEERPEARARFEEAFAVYISWIRGAARHDVR